MSSYESGQDLTDPSDNTDIDDALGAAAVLADTAEVARETEVELVAEAVEKADEAVVLDELAHVASAQAGDLEDMAVELIAEAEEAHEVAETAAAEGDESTAEAAVEVEAELLAEAEVVIAEADELEIVAEEAELAAVDAATEAVDDLAVAEVLEEVAEVATELEDEVVEEIEAEVEAEVEADIEAVLDEDALLESSVPDERPISPYDRPGRWFVVHTQSGYEKKVKQNLEARISSMNMEERIYEVVIPMEDVVEFKGGKKVVVQKKMFPGYLLVRCAMDDDSWYVIRNTPGVTGFVGQGAKPSPLPRRDVESFLQVKLPEEEGGEPARRGRTRHEYEMGETVRIKEGPFADFSGQITEINEDQLKVKVEVDIFGRPTPVELEFSQIAKL